MTTDGPPVLSLLRSTMGWLTQRQKTLAENVANANTPGYTPNDISSAAFEKALGDQARSREQLLRTSSDKHIVAASGSAGLAPAGLKPSEAPVSVTKINGNSVVLEDQMAKVAESRMHYEAVVGLYQKSLNMIRSASRSPGRG